MEIVYNIILNIAEFYLHSIAKNNRKKGKKIGLMAKGQENILQHIEQEFETRKTNKPVMWFHASSLGELNILLPVIQEIKSKQEVSILLTFFSPTGYEYLKNKPNPIFDFVFYLPLDKKKNAKRFLDIIQPERAVFAVAELWPNYLEELQKRNIKITLISCLYRQDASYNKWYGGIFRKALMKFDCITTVTESSQKGLEGLGCKHVVKVGDPLFDKAYLNTQTTFSNAIVEKFVQQHDVFVAGSIHKDSDLDLTSSLCNRYKDIRFLIVPHEISVVTLRNIRYKLEGRTLLYSECDETTDFSNVQNLIIDFVGSLSYLYRYGKWAYVGGGFTRYLHSVVEAAVYGIPVAFGPRMERTTTPYLLLENGMGTNVSTEAEINEWFEKAQEKSYRDKVSKIAQQFIREQQGASAKIAELIKNPLPSS